ncbi:MAG: hypothetical protein JXA37_05195 [Chloroflexia bacterium]|nr:hypothetical protein [Chloroflexia bacterium]
MKGAARPQALGAMLIVLLLAACAPAWPGAATGVPPTPLAQPSPTCTPAPASPSPSLPTGPAVVPTATPRSTVTPGATPTPSDLYLAVEGVALYPGPGLYSGDVVTFDLQPYNLGDIQPGEIQARVYHQTAAGPQVVAEGYVGYPGFDAVPRARLVWAWDTAGLVGPQELTLWLDPDDLIQAGDERQDNNVVELAVDLQPAVERRALEVGAAWESVRTDCCILHYLSGSSAERDLDALLALTESGVGHTQEILGEEMGEPLEVYLISRVIAHGAYARDELVLSYLDRRYNGGDLLLAVRHEAVHVLDRELLGEGGWPPAIMREGLAVWVARGHFKPEEISLLAAALPALDMYIPLELLADDFYRQQHEVGYLEAAAIVTYLVDTYGWEAFLDFYTGFESAGSGSEMMDRALSEHFGLGLADFEAVFLQWLREQPTTPGHERDLQSTVYFFDTLRRYEALYDPQAYFMSGWLPDPSTAEQRGIEADFLRHPRSLEHVALEMMLIDAREAQLARDYDGARCLLDAVQRVLDEGAFGAAPASDYWGVTHAVAAVGYEAQYVDLDGTSARVWAIALWPELEEIVLQRTVGGWVLSTELD